MTHIDASHLPHVQLTAAEQFVIAQHDVVRVTAPQLSSTQLSELCDGLIAARARLRDMPIARVVAAIDAATQRLRDPASDACRVVRESLVTITGYSQAMAALTLERVSQDWLAPALHHLVRAELGSAADNAGVIQRSATVGTRMVSPALAFHVFSGNVPGVSVTSLIRSLLVRTAVLGKSAAAEPTLAAVFARLLADADADIGACVAVTYWPGGDIDREATVLAKARLVVHYGGADAIASLRARAPQHVRLVEHGPKISFAIVRPHAMSGAAVQNAADQLARAVALFDQQGCVSPQLVYVVGDSSAGRDFARSVAHALDDLADELPRGRIGPSEAAAVHDTRTRAEFGAIAGRDILLWKGAALSYTVIFTGDAAFEGTCLNRTLFVKSAASAAEIISEAAPFAAYLQTVGVAGFSADELIALAVALGDIGVSRVTSLAAMPWPPATWHHDGRGPLRELVTWLDVDN